jgi:hypothetical protein
MSNLIEFAGIASLGAVSTLFSLLIGKLILEALFRVVAPVRRFAASRSANEFPTLPGHEVIRRG